MSSWRDHRGLRWAQVLAEAREISMLSCPSVILVLHTGGNDLCLIRLPELLTLIRVDIDRILGYFAEIILVCSEVILRVVWQGAREAWAVERARRTLNTRILDLFTRGVVVKHRQLEDNNSCLMRADEVHLNEIGLYIFL